LIGLGVIAVLCAFGVKYVLRVPSPSPIHHQENQPVSKKSPPYAFPAGVAEDLASSRSLVIYLVGIPPQPGDASEEGMRKSSSRSRRRPGGEETFHGFPVFGSAQITSPQSIKAIVVTLLRGVENSKGDVMACFYPRHGVQATLSNGRRLDLVICYMCGYMKVYLQGQSAEEYDVSEVNTADDSRQPLNRVLQAAGVDLKQPVISFWPKP